jgi:tRNA A-37 threonylcarbamoyl transferase component Bud32
VRLSLAEQVVIGRAEQGPGGLNDDPELSRRHAVVKRLPSGLTIEDLGSANGTFVNGDRIREPRPLVLGDIVRVGRTTMQLTVAGQEPTGAAAPAAAPPSPPPAAVPAPPARPPAASPPPPSAPPARPPSPAPPRVRPAPAPPPDALPAGTVIAGCRVEQVIGHGDMGVVYKAEELALQRHVALKLIRPDHSEDAHFRERFRRESRVAASIDHPNVIPILEAGEENGMLFISMRLVEGTDLRELIVTEGPLDPLRVARIVRQVGAALDAAHSRGLVHRDVKPPNVLLARADHVYLSDFGLAKRQEEGVGLTRQGSIVARAEYVAPEQLLEDRVDALTDVYTLGCLLFESLTGEAPYATSQDPGMLAHVNEPPPSPLERRPDLPPMFDEVIHRAMAKQPADRYPSAGNLGDAALVAAGAQRRAGREASVATGDAAPFLGAPLALAGLSKAGAAVPPAAAGSPAPGSPSPSPAAAGSPSAAAAEPAAGTNTLRWAFALGVLVLLFVCMLLALNALSTL